MTYNQNSGPGYASYGSPQDAALRLAQAQLAEGSSTAPIRSKWQGVARLAQALQGGLAERQAMQGWQQGQQDRLNATNGGAGAAPGAMTGGLPAAPGALEDRHKQRVSRMLELSPKDIRAEIRHLEACIRKVDETRVDRHRSPGTALTHFGHPSA